MADYCTVSDVKAHLSIQHSGDDVLLAGLVSSGSKWFESQIGRVLAASDYVEVLDGNGGRAVVTGNFPVISVSSVVVNGETVDASPSYDVAGWYLAGDVIRFRGMALPDGEGNVEVSYRAGFELEAIPADVKQSVIDYVALLYRERDRVGQQSRNDASGSVVFYYQLPARVLQTIETYRRGG